MDHALASVDDLFMRQPVTLKKAQLVAGLLGAFSSLAFAEKAADLNDDFMEYLGQMEDNDDNWSDFVDRTAAKQDMASTHAEHSSASSATSVSSRSDGKAAGRTRP